MMLNFQNILQFENLKCFGIILISSITCILNRNFRIRDAMSDIYYGRIEHPWALDLENWPEQTMQEIKRLQKYQESIDQHVASLG